MSNEQRWWATPALVTSGLYAEYLRADGDVRLTAGHRIDFIGDADLGQDPRIGRAGRCCSCAIEPRTEMILGSTAPHRDCR